MESSSTASTPIEIPEPNQVRRNPLRACRTRSLLTEAQRQAILLADDSSSDGSYNANASGDETSDNSSDFEEDDEESISNIMQDVNMDN